MSNLLPCSEHRWRFSREVIKNPGDAKLITLQSHQDPSSKEVSYPVKISPNSESISDKMASAQLIIQKGKIYRKHQV